MQAIIICSLEVLVPSLAAVIYGFFAIMRRYRGLYFTMGYLAVVCLLIGQLAYCAFALTGYSETTEFSIGALGSTGTFLFFLTANIGPVDTIADDRSPEFRKYRYLALIGPAASALLFCFAVIMMAVKGSFSGLVSGIALTAITLLPIYYSTKMSVIPDVEGGFIDCMRPFNRAVTVLGILTTVERGFRNLCIESTAPAAYVLSYIVYGGIGLCTVGIMAALKKGAKRWKNI